MTGGKEREMKSKIEKALKDKNLRHYVDAIEGNGHATPNEVVLWIHGMGHPVYSVAQAIALVRKIMESEGE